MVKQLLLPIRIIKIIKQRSGCFNQRFKLLSEKHLIEQCQQFQEVAQFELVKRYTGMLMSVSRRYAVDEAMAKDIVQETFLIIFKNIQNYQPIGSFEAWMRKITIRCALKWINQKYYKKEEFIAKYKECLSTIEPKIYSQLSTQEILKQIKELPTGFRVVLNLFLIEGYSHKEIAELLGIKESTSRSQLARAKKIVAAKINALL